VQIKEINFLLEVNKVLKFSRH